MNKIIQIGNIRNGTKTFDNPQSGRIYSELGIAPTINTCQGGGLEPKLIVIDDTFGYEKMCRAYKNYVPALRSERSGLKVMVDTEDVDSFDTPYRIRKLTPKECWRLMGFSDKDFDNARQAINDKFHKGKDKANSQLYKQAGNSIVTDVLYYIFKELYSAMPYLFDDLRVSSYFSGIGAFEIGLDRLFDDINNATQQTTSNTESGINAVGFSMVGDFGNRKPQVSENAYCLAANPSSDMTARIVEIDNNKCCDETIVYDDYNSNIRKDQDTIGTITTNIGNDAIRNGYKLITTK